MIVEGLHQESLLQDEIMENASRSKSLENMID